MPEWQAGHESHFSKKRDRRCEKLISNFRTALQTLKKLDRFNDNFFFISRNGLDFIVSEVQIEKRSLKKWPLFRTFIHRYIGRYLGKIDCFRPRVRLCAIQAMYVLSLHNNVYRQGARLRNSNT
jgi:hypothetical protein